MALPGSTKSFEQFQVDGVACQQYAQQSIGGYEQSANNAAASSAVAGTLIGAAAGAVIGSVSGQAGPGAAIGAGTGLLFGSASGANAAGWSSNGMQRSYDQAYLQCMYGKGHQVPVPAGYRGRREFYGPPGGPPPAYGPPGGVAPPYGPPPAYYGSPPPAS